MYHSQNAQLIKTGYIARYLQLCDIRASHTNANEGFDGLSQVNTTKKSPALLWGDKDELFQLGGYECGMFITRPSQLEH